METTNQSYILLVAQNGPYAPHTPDTMEYEDTDTMLFEDGDTMEYE